MNICPHHSFLLPANNSFSGSLLELSGLPCIAGAGNRGVVLPDGSGNPAGLIFCWARMTADGSFAPVRAPHPMSGRAQEITNGRTRTGNRGIVLPYGSENPAGLIFCWARMTADGSFAHVRAPYPMPGRAQEVANGRTRTGNRGLVLPDGSGNTAGLIFSWARMTAEEADRSFAPHRHCLDVCRRLAMAGRSS